MDDWNLRHCGSKQLDHQLRALPSDESDLPRACLKRLLAFMHPNHQHVVRYCSKKTFVPCGNVSRCGSSACSNAYVI